MTENTTSATTGESAAERVYRDTYGESPRQGIVRRCGAVVARRFMNDAVKEPTAADLWSRTAHEFAIILTWAEGTATYGCTTYINRCTDDQIGRVIRACVGEARIQLAILNAPAERGADGSA